MFTVYVMNDFLKKQLEVKIAHNDRTYLTIPIRDAINGTQLTREDTISIINFLSEFTFIPEFR
jgi:hypothetical protein